MTVPTAPPRGLLRPALPWLVLALSLIAGMIAVSRESFWIDEANSALKATQPTLSGWWNVLLRERGSDLQMPLFMFQLWAWEKISGASELALRSINILWFFLGQAALLWGLRRHLSLALLTIGLAAISPLLWFYLNDARPYIMQYAGACLLCGALLRGRRGLSGDMRTSWIWGFGAGLVVLCGSSLLGVIWAAGAVGAWIFLHGSAWKTLAASPARLPLSVTAVCLAALGGFYLWTLTLGAGASTVGNTRLLNLAFISYEFSGIAGLGPGRLEIREDGFAAFAAMDWMRLLGIIVPAILALAVFLAGLWTARKRLHPRIQAAGVIYTIPPGLLLLALGYWRDFRLVGRHFIPLLPPMLGLMALGIIGLLAFRRTLGTLAGVALGGVWLISSLCLRFEPRHRKDDYRGAARLAKAALARNEIVWWSADLAAARYYEVPVESAASHDRHSVILMLHPTPDRLAALAQPDTVISSKPDVYDSRTDALGTFLVENNFAPVRDLPAFTIWRRPAAAEER